MRQHKWGIKGTTLNIVVKRKDRIIVTEYSPRLRQLKSLLSFTNTNYTPNEEGHLMNWSMCNILNDTSIFRIKKSKTLKQKKATEKEAQETFITLKNRIRALL